MPHLGSQPPSISTAAEDCGAWPAQVPVCDGGGEIQAAFAPVPCDRCHQRAAPGIRRGAGARDLRRLQRRAAGGRRRRRGESLFEKAFGVSWHRFPGGEQRQNTRRAGCLCVAEALIQPCTGKCGQVLRRPEKPSETFSLCHDVVHCLHVDSVITGDALCNRQASAYCSRCAHPAERWDGNPVHLVSFNE